MTVGLGKLRYIGDLDATLPENSALTAEIRTVRQLFGTNDTIVFVVNGPDFQHRLRATCDLAKKLRNDPDVLPRTIAGLGASSTNILLNTNGSLSIEKSDALCARSELSEAQILDGLGPQKDFLVGADEALVIYADLDIKNGAYLPFRERALQYIESVSSEGVTIRMTGQPSFLSAMQIFSERMGLFFPLIMLVIGALHFEALRSVQAVVLPLFTGLLATALTLGSMGWIGIALDEYSSTAPILILAVAAGHSVQLLKRYMEELASRSVGGVVTRDANDQALIASLTSMAPVLVAAVGTASLCLFSLAIFDIEAIARFGLIAGCGLLYSLAIELSVMPAIRAVRPPKKLRLGFGNLSPHWARLLAAMHALVLRTTIKQAALIAIPLMLAIAWGISNLKLTASITEPFSEQIPERVAISELSRQRIGTFPLDIVFDSGLPEKAFEPALLAAAAELTRRLQANPNIAAVASPVSVMKFLKCRFSEITDCSTVEIMSQEEASQMWTLFSGPGEAYPLVDQDWRYLRIRAFAYSDNSVFMKPVEDLAREVSSKVNARMMLGGPAIMAKALGDGIFRATGFKVLIIVAISGLAGLLLFRSWLAALLFMIPSGVSAASCYAFLGLTGTTLNVATASIAALAVGVGVDYLIYFTFRLREYLGRGLGWDEALRRTYLTAGGASLCVATAVAGGYGVLNFSFDFNVHQWLGQLIPLAIVAGLFATLMIYPLTLHFLKPRFLGATHANR
ncbi:MAG: efflux RND transporter permease subunit [Panacagrimonas sp.]